MNFLHARDLLASDQVAALGSIAAEWSMLEAVVSVAIWDYLILGRNDGLAVTSDLGSLAKIKMLRALALLRFENRNTEAAKKIKHITGQMEELNTKRNSYLHNLWEADHVIGQMRGTRASTRDGRLKETPLAVHFQELYESCVRIEGLVDELLMFQTDYGVVPPSHPKPQQSS